MNKRERIVCYSSLGTAFVLFCFFDLPLAQTAFHPSNLFGRIFEIAGEVPCFLTVLFACALLIFFHPHPKKKGADCLLTVLFSLAYALLLVYAVLHFYSLLKRSLGGSAPKWAMAFPFFFYLPIPLAIALLVKKERGKEAFAWAIYALIVSASCLLLMQGLKMLWLRPRYRTLVALFGDEASLHWKAVYQPQGFWNFESRYGDLGAPEVLQALGITSWGKEEFYSFPSGHTMNTACTMSFAFAGAFFPALKGKRRFIVRGSVYLWASLTGISRMIRGAHYGSDVAMGFLLGLLAVDLFAYFLYPHLRNQFVSGEAPASEKD